VHLRSPSVAAGVSAFLWSLLFAVCVWLFLLGIGSSRAMSVLCGLLTLCVSFVFIRTSGRQGRLKRRS
jgi:Flp pilus assembly protein TadB